jgi:hypothetical protein
MFWRTSVTPPGGTLGQDAAGVGIQPVSWNAPIGSEHRHDPSQSTPASGPNAWQLVLWRLLALVAHAMRRSADNTRWSTALNGYVRRHPVRGAAYVAAAWFGAFLVIEFMALPVVVLLESLHFRPRGAGDFGATVLRSALCSLCGLPPAAGSGTS